MEHDKNTIIKHTYLENVKSEENLYNVIEICSLPYFEKLFPGAQNLTLTKSSASGEQEFQ